MNARTYVLAVLCACLVWAVPVSAAELVVYVPASNGTDETAAMQGLVGITNCCPNQFVQIDPISGAFTTLSEVGDMSFGFGSPPAVDPATHNFYITRLSTSDFIWHLVSINTQTGALLEGPPLAQGIFGLGFDSAGSNLVGITNCCPNQFVRIDPSSGTLTTLSEVGDLSFGFGSPPAVDPATHSYYITRLSTSDFIWHLVSINTQTGALLEGPALAQGLFALGFDSANSKLVGITYCCPNQFVQIDPASGAFTVLSEIGDSSFGFGSSPAVNPATHTFYTTRLSNPDFIWHLVGVNTDTGVLVESPPLGQGVFALGLDPSAPVPTPDALISAIDTYLSNGAIKNTGLAHSLIAKVNAAIAATARGSCPTGSNVYRALAKEVRAQSGIGITEDAAASLVSQAEFLATAACS